MHKFSKLGEFSIFGPKTEDVMQRGIGTWVLFSVFDVSIEKHNVVGVFVFYRFHDETLEDEGLVCAMATFDKENLFIRSTTFFIQKEKL